MAPGFKIGPVLQRYDNGQDYMVTEGMFEMKAVIHGAAGPLEILYDYIFNVDE